MTGSAEQYQYILRDESMHCNFGIDPYQPDQDGEPRTCGLQNSARRFRASSGRRSSSNIAMPRTMPRGVLGLNAPMFKEYLRYIANRRCQQIGVDQMFRERAIRFLDERDDRSQEGAEFFETRVIEYQTGVRSVGTRPRQLRSNQQGTKEFNSPGLPGGWIARASTGGFVVS